MENASIRAGMVAGPQNPHASPHPIIIVLDNVRSAFNVGSLFRTGETAGIAELVTVGITCRPPNPKLRKTALSSMDVVPSRHFDDIMDCIETLKKEGYTIITMETTDKSKLYTEVEYPKNCAFILGNEVTGVDTRVMDKSDLIVEIPTFGVNEHYQYYYYSINTIITTILSIL